MSNKEHSRSALQWLTIRRKEVLVTCSLCFLFVLLSRSYNAQSATYVDSSLGSFDPDDDAEPIVAPVKKKKKVKKIQGVSDNHPTDKVVQAGSFSEMFPPVETFAEGVICPNVGKGGKNRQCSKGVVRYKFDVTADTMYYLYVEAIGPTIMDNSLWIGAEGVQEKTLFDCDLRQPAGATVPHKHVSKSRWLCCPKYLDKNARKGQGDFYTQCCFQALGPNGDEHGCVLDLEVDTRPHWNQVPRKLLATQDEVVVSLYAREDGTAVTRLMLSTSPTLRSDQLF